MVDPTDEGEAKSEVIAMIRSVTDCLVGLTTLRRQVTGKACRRGEGKAWKLTTLFGVCSLKRGTWTMNIKLKFFRCMMI